MKKYKIGDIVTGCVTGIENYGIFVSLDDYYSGLIHISEISNNFVRNVHDYVEMGETIHAKVIEENEKEHHVKLSIKDIDYKINKMSKVKIAETPSGFSSLGKNLDKWVDKKIKEIEAKSVQNS